MDNKFSTKPTESNDKMDENSKIKNSNKLSLTEENTHPITILSDMTGYKSSEDSDYNEDNLSDISSDEEIDNISDEELFDLQEDTNRIIKT